MAADRRFPGLTAPWDAPPAELPPPWELPPVEDGRGIRPSRVLVIASTQRSGSSLLSRALAEVGAVGRPKEYFEANIIGQHRTHWGVPRLTLHGRAGIVRRRVERRSEWWGSYRYTRPSMTEYRRRLLHEHTTGDGWFAVKIQWATLEAFRGSPWDPLTWGIPLTWVHLSRQDTVRQAVSLVRAQQTGAWNSELAGDGFERYDPSRITSAVEFLRRSDAQWRRLFAGQGITPIETTYESLAADYEAAVGGVLAALGMGHLAVPPPPIERQADATTEDWVTRYLAEQQGASRPGAGP